MSTNSPNGKREQNKSEKLARIIASARNLLATVGESGVTTAQVAKSAEVATGTLFLYAKNKGELLLLSQNADYVSALQEGIRQSVASGSLDEALRSLWFPIFRCNRKHVENGRAYLREVMFGDPLEPNRAEAIRLMNETTLETQNLISSFSSYSHAEAAERAQLISAAAFVTLANPVSLDLHLEELIGIFIGHIRPILQSI